MTVQYPVPATMRELFLLGLALASASCSLVYTPPTTTLMPYDSEFDDIDLDEILQDRSKFVPRVNCLLDLSECPPDAAQVKQNLAEALETGCRRCTEKQRAGALKVMSELSNYHPELMQKLYDRFDPEGLYRTKYKLEFIDAGIKLLQQP